MNITIHNLKIHVISTLGSLNIGSSVLANNTASHIINANKPGTAIVTDDEKSSTRLES